MLEDMVAELEAERKAPGYIADLMKTVRSWLRGVGRSMLAEGSIPHPVPISWFRTLRLCHKIGYRSMSAVWTSRFKSLLKEKF